MRVTGDAEKSNQLPAFKNQRRRVVESTFSTARGVRVTILLLAAAFLQACGGGGGGGSNPAEATLTVARSSLVFDAEHGDEAQSQAIQGSLTGVQSPLTVLIEYTNRGIGSASFSSTSTTTGELTVTPKPSADLAPGVYADTITVRACYDAACSRQAAGSPRQVDVSYTVRPAAPAPVLAASERGIAFAAVPGGQRLSHSVIITEATGASSGWLAGSDAAWLTVTPSGSIGGALVLSADPSILADGTHLATVTVRSNGGNAVRDEILRVGLYKSGVAPADRLAEPLGTSGGTSLVSDPVRPLVYVAYGNTLAAQHFHTGARVGTITLPSSNVLTLAVSDDGRSLYSLNRDASTTSVTVVDLDTFQMSGQLQGLQFQGVGGMTFSRVAGQPVLILNEGSGFTAGPPIISAESGVQIGAVNGLHGWDFTTFKSAHGGVVYSAEMGITGGGLRTTRIQLRANSHSVYATITQTPPENVVSGLTDYAAHPDGSKVILSYYGSSLRQAVFTGTSLLWQGGLPGTGVSATDIEFLADGRCVTVSGNTLRLYALDNTVQFQWVGPTSGTSPFGGYSGTIRVSSDGLRLLGNGVFVDLPPR